MSTAPAYDPAAVYTGNWILLPLTMLATVLPAAILATVCVHRRSLLRSEFDYVVTILMFVMLLWSLHWCVYVIHALIEGNAGPTSYQRLNTAMSMLSLLWIVVTNMLLALFRFFTSSDKPDAKKKTKLWFKGTIGAAIAISLGIALVCAFVPNLPFDFGFEFSERIDKVGIQAIGFGVFLFFVLLWIAVIYKTTYRMLSGKLSDAWTSSLDLKVRLLLQKKRLKTGIMMGTCTIIAYLPWSIAVILAPAFGDYGLLNYPVEVLFVLSGLSLLDCVATPMMILIFEPMVRKRLYQSLGLYTSFEETEESISLSESSNQSGNAQTL